MATKRLRSKAPIRRERPVKIPPDDIPNLKAAVAKIGAKALGLSDRAFDYWLAGYLPKAVRVLLDHPELAAALYRDAERKAVRKQLDAK